MLGDKIKCGECGSDYHCYKHREHANMGLQQAVGKRQSYLQKPTYTRRTDHQLVNKGYQEAEKNSLR